MTNRLVKKNGAYTLSFGKAFDIRRRQLFLFLHRTSKSKRIMPRFNRDGIKRFTLKFDVFRVPMERELCSPGGGRKKFAVFSVRGLKRLRKQGRTLLQKKKECGFA